MIITKDHNKLVNQNNLGKRKKCIEQNQHVLLKLENGLNTLPNIFHVQVDVHEYEIAVDMTFGMG